MRLRLVMSEKSKSATIVPSPSVSGGTANLPSGVTIAVKHPPRKGPRVASFGEIVAI